MRLLLVEDDPELGRRLSDRLRGSGFAVELATSRNDAEDWPDVDKMGAIILDLGLPDGDGLDLLRQWRDARVETPILILTARGSWQDKVEGLNAGADDFVVKPVRFEELQARLNALFRRQQGSRSNVLEAGDLSLDPVARTVAQGGRAVAVSKQEFRLLHLFMRRAGQVMSQAEILDDLYELDAERELNTVEVLVGRLRRKIGRTRIVTMRGMGYRFDR
ncbi:DNA-binding response regulator [Altererythrobacter sp. FM1]|jgi:two-component system OmpR family response regulator|uniref:Response regulator transcription factor n=1 Tax=Tsuneonella flava TaxID=2055955 RepID=A0ABX7K5B6_9SPHN|nr:response regulator transcription factor [Tsuneonella flava]QSB43403.1 response regulator transcription factor [Tsuneonella flava]ROT93503.1 DNA-binding response regulator [Altererythrobacter sp. FM1]